VKRLSLISWLPLAALALAGGIHSASAAWQLVWSDEFAQADGSSPDPTKWGYDVGNGSGGWGNAQLEYDTARTNNARIVGGQLVIEADQESYGGKSYTSARMLTKGFGAWAYGRMEARIKLPRGQGIWPAFWMLGTNIDSVGWPKCGEIDIMENIGKTSDQGTDHGTIHGPQSGGDYNGGSGVGGTYTLPGGAALADDFHIYAIEWTTNQIKWFLDNNQFFTATPASLPSGGTWVFTNAQYLILNLAVGGNWPGNPDGTTVFPQQMLVDYVRVYAAAPSTNAPTAPTGLAAGPGNSKAYLTWDASNSGATGYNVKRSTVSGGSYTTIASPTANSYTDTTASSCSTYYYVVSATNAFGESTNSSETTASLGAYALAVNSGGVAAGQFLADAYFSGGSTSSSGSTVDTSAVTAPAPQAVYQSERHGACTYTFTSLTFGLNYKVRLHFAENYWTAVGQRIFNVSINGKQVLTNYDIIAAAGAANKANIQEFTTVPTSTNTIVVSYSNISPAKDQPKASGIEILIPQPAAPAGLMANAGNSQVALKWNAFAGAGYNVKRALSGSGPYNSVVNGLTSTNYTDPGLTNGTTYYYVVSAAIAGCESTNSAPVSATPACSPPPAPTAGNNGPICASSTLNLTASTVPGATYSWTGPNGFSSSAQNPSIGNATTSASGSYSVTATVSGCTSLAGTAVAVVNAIPSAPTAGNNGPICSGSTLTLTASTVPGAAYSWTGPNGFTSTNQNPTIVSASTAACGLYSVTVTANACPSEAGTTTVTINPPAGLSIQCLGSDMILTWPTGTLQSATNVSGPWNDVSGVTSPSTNPAAAPQEFFRCRLP
jgi:beta-glucanase (GH16 family)